MPPIFTPLAALACAAVLYTSLYNHRKSESSACLLIPYVFFICLLCYAFTTIVLNLLELWGVMRFPAEFVFFSTAVRPFPASQSAMLRMHIRDVFPQEKAYGLQRLQPLNVKQFCTEPYRNNLRVRIVSSTAQHDDVAVRTLVRYNLDLLPCVLHQNQCQRTRLVLIHTWLTVIAFLLDEVYFLFRYYNLYLDLKENDEIISEQEIDDMGAQTYVRYYVICENNIYVDSHAVEDYSAYKEVIDTPFRDKTFGQRNDSRRSEAHNNQMTGIVDGELRFFFRTQESHDAQFKPAPVLLFHKAAPRRRMPLPLRTEGEWMDYAEIQRIYSNNPGNWPQCRYSTPQGLPLSF